MKAKYTIALAMIGSFALGAAAVQGLHAQSKPPAYVIAEINVTDKDGYATSQGIAAGTSMLRLLGHARLGAEFSPSIGSAGQKSRAAWTGAKLAARHCKTLKTGLRRRRVP